MVRSLSLAKINPSPGDFNHCLELGGWQIGWQGLVYVGGHRAGHDSARVLLEQVIEQGVESASLVAHGIHWLCIESPDGMIYHLVDPAGQQRLYYSAKRIGSSYLALLKAEGIGLADFDSESIIEFMNLGRLGANHTHTSQIRVLGADERLVVGSQAGVALQQRNLPRLDPVGDSSPETFFARFADSLRGKKVSVDLTGGLDSRLIAGMLASQGLDFDTGLSGASHYSEFDYAAQVSERLGRKFVRYGHSLDHLEDDLRLGIRRCEGVIDVVASHRPARMHEQRSQQGYEVVVGGVGGELFNDYTLIQDLPFGSGKRANLERFFDLRLAPLLLPSRFLSSDLAADQKGFRARLLNRLERYRRHSAIDTYLTIFYRHRVGPAAAAQASASLRRGLIHLMPLLDFSLVSQARQLDSSDRWMSGWHRQLIHRHAAELVGIPSTSGLAAYPGRIGALRDALGYASYTLQRGVRKLEQRALKRRYRQESPDHQDLYLRLRQTGVALKAFHRLSELGVLHPELCFDALPDVWLGRVVTLGLIDEALTS